MRKVELEIPDDVVEFVERRAALAGVPVEAFLSTAFSEFITNPNDLRHPSQHSEDSRLYGISLILWSAWDPIMGVPPNEYDMYASQIDAMLADGAAVGAIAVELEWIRTERMGLGGGGPDNLTAAKLVTWYHARMLY